MLSLGFAIVSLFCKSVQIVMLSLGFAIVSLFGTLKSSSHDAIAWFCDSITFWYFEKSVQVVMLSLGFAIVSLFGTLKKVFKS